MLIHKPLQREYTILMIGVMMFSTLLVAFIIHTTMKQAFLGDPYRVGRVSPYEILSKVNEQLVMRICLTLFGCIILATGIGIFFLHRVAGPVYRFRMILKKLANGEIPNDVRLRENDYFKETAAEFNNVFKSLREKRLLAQESAADLEKLEAENFPSNVQNILRQVKDYLRKI